MENIIAENVSLREILNNLNSSLYPVNEYNNIRITSKNKVGYIVLCIEADVSENLVKFFESFVPKEKNLKFERTYNDYIVVSIDEKGNFIESSTISLFELILSSEILQIDELDKWFLDTPDFNCIEINYIENTELSLDNTDMKLFG